jgi:cystathionine gamma-synthase
MERHQSNAIAVAKFLQTHQLVEHVYYPALEHHPGHVIQNGQTSGNTGIFSFKIKSGAYVEAILRHIKLIAFAESLGGVESLMTYPMVQTHSNIPEDIRNAIGVDEKLLRISCGIEHPDDLIADLAQAFAAAEAELGGVNDAE